MGSFALIFFLQNVFIFCLIFWLLTFIAEFFFKKKNSKIKEQFYECGFKSLGDLNIQININFSIVCVFLVLYDVEFIFFYPFFFNFNFINNVSYIIILFFFILIFLCLVYDLINNSLNINL